MFLSSKTKWLSLLSIGLLNIPLWLAVVSREPDNYLTVNFLDVGQGDAIFIETPFHNQVLIDGGPGSAVLSQLGQVMPFYDKEIDLVILTHPDADHLSGLVEVVERYKVNKVVTTGVKTNTKEFQVWQKAIQNKNIPIQIAEADQVIKLSQNIHLYVLTPFEDVDGKEVKDLNETSIVNRLVYGDFKALLTGDAEFKTEKELLERDIFIDSDVLKVGHHGSKNSTSQDFLDVVSPEVAVIQVGENNRYHHPTAEVLGRLKNIKVYRTDQDGRIEVKSDGKGYRVVTKK